MAPGCQGKGLVCQANWGMGLMVVSVEERELVGENSPLRSRRAGINRSGWEYSICQLLQNLLHHLVATVVSLVLLL